MSRARILLVDDHELFRDGLTNLIDDQADMEVVGQAGDGFEALKLARDLRPDLIVMDINMPVCDGLEATRLIRAAPEVGEVRILILTIHEEDKRLFEAIKAGANGYLLKNARSTDFLQSLRVVLRGESVLPSKLAARLFEEFARVADRPQPLASAGDEPDLTSREVEVLGLIATGATDKEIATRLSLSVHTVKSHVRSILNKLHTVNRRQAARLAIRQGWVNGKQIRYDDLDPNEL
ncbi:MAG: response regulator [Anaerolineae bacterium]